MCRAGPHLGLLPQSLWSIRCHSDSSQELRWPSALALLGHCWCSCSSCAGGNRNCGRRARRGCRAARLVAARGRRRHVETHLQLGEFLRAGRPGHTQPEQLPAGGRRAALSGGSDRPGASRACHPAPRRAGTASSGAAARRQHTCSLGCLSCWSCQGSTRRRAGRAEVHWTRRAARRRRRGRAARGGSAGTGARGARTQRARSPARGAARSLRADGREAASSLGAGAVWMQRPPVQSCGRGQRWAPHLDASLPFARGIGVAGVPVSLPTALRWSGDRGVGRRARACLAQLASGRVGGADGRWPRRACAESV
jgi:hypothetical protein